MEHRKVDGEPKSKFKDIIKSGVLETKYGNVQVFDPEFWRNPTVWKAPDGSFVPTVSVVITALYIGSLVGVGASTGLTMLNQANNFIKTAEGHAKAADLIISINKSVIEGKNSIALYLCGLFSGVEIVNIKAALKFRDFGNEKLEDENKKIERILDDMESDSDTKNLLKVVWIKNYLEKCFTDIRRRKSSEQNA